MKTILDLKGLWKKYQRGAQKEKYLSIRDSLFKGLTSSSKKELFWALEDINFSVNPGDSLANIGKKGAGKSTLLKILSKITPPTRGEIILRGRLASLLEVGTGFHPELTGHENIYLNGSIPGLGRQEINSQFEAIVDFSGVEDFLDTPLKHYSSGMQLRLAFAVAAHVEPEILVIDEVLAMGDSAFQQKCIDKMTEVSQSGRTILFDSNMQAVKNLCNQAILIENGTLTKSGKTDAIISTYSSGLSATGDISGLDSIKNRRGKGDLIFQELLLTSPVTPIGEPIKIGRKLKIIGNKSFQNLDFGIAILDFLNYNLIHISNKYCGKLIDHISDMTTYWFGIMNELKSGKFKLALFLKANEEIEDWITDSVFITIGEGNRYNYSNSKEIQGFFQPEFQFYTRNSKDVDEK